MGEKLKDKVAIVTGAGTGIGKKISIALAEEGADIAIVYASSREGAEKTLESVEGFGRRGLLLKADLSKPEEIRAVVEETVNHFGHIDIVVNNGAARDPALFLDSSFEKWKHTIDTNLRGDLLMIHYVVPYMKKQGGGKIINIASVMGYRPCMLERVGYQSSKSGIVALTQAAAVELGPFGIYVNAIAPGTIDANATRYSKEAVTAKLRAMEDQISDLGNAVPLKRRGVSEDIVGPAVFLASGDSDYVDGICMIVDGGWSAGD